MPFFGTVSVGYLPSGKVLGLSKVARYAPLLESVHLIDHLVQVWSIALYKLHVHVLRATHALLYIA